MEQLLNQVSRNFDFHDLPTLDLIVVVVLVPDTICHPTNLLTDMIYALSYFY